MRHTCLATLLLLAVAGCTIAPPAAPATPAAATTTATKYADAQQVRVTACAKLGSGQSRPQVVDVLQEQWKVTAAEAETAIDDAQAADGLCPK